MTLNEIHRDIAYGNILDAEKEKRDGMPEEKRPRYIIISVSNGEPWGLEAFIDDYRVHSTQPDYILMELETADGDSSLPPWISSETDTVTSDPADVDSTATYAIIDEELSRFDGKEWVRKDFTQVLKQ